MSNSALRFIVGLYGILFLLVGTFNAMTISQQVQQYIGADYELVYLLKPFAHIPLINHSDAQGADDIKIAAVVSLGLTVLSLSHALGRNVANTYPLKEFLIAGPKGMGFLISMLYDFIRYHDAQNLSQKKLSELDKARYKSFKAQQYIKLLFEVGLRFLVYINANCEQNGTVAAIGHLADFVELWRLISRFETYFGISGYELHYSLTLRQAKERGSGVGLDAQVDDFSFKKEEEKTPLTDQKV